MEMIDHEFTCFYCGVCCSKFQPQLSQEEAEILAEKLGVSWELFVEKYTDSRWPGIQSYLLRQKEGACVFLECTSDGLKLCQIHSFKPDCCLKWKAGPYKDECLEGLRTRRPLKAGP
jgi:Fe-S-cluster containining protein